MHFFFGSVNCDVVYTTTHINEKVTSKINKITRVLKNISLFIQMTKISGSCYCTDQTERESIAS